MLGYCTYFLTNMPDITVYMNCDTRLAIDLSMLELGVYDEFIFVIKNYDYIDSPYVFLFRARKADLNENGEVIFNIDPDISKNIKPDAFYNLAVLVNAYSLNEPTEYRKLSENGKINIEYGAHDLALPEQEEPLSPFSEIISAKLEPTEEDSRIDLTGVISNIRIE